VTTLLGLGNVVVSTAGGPQSVERFGPMAAPTARAWQTSFSVNAAKLVVRT